MLQGTWLRKLNEFCNAGRKDITDVLKLASTEYMNIIMQADDDDVDEEDVEEEEDKEEEDKETDEEEDNIEDDEEETIVLEEENNDDSHKNFKIELEKWLESFKVSISIFMLTI
jgi:ABC-type Zn2+ transport system substrate-binding protein/surface adhesin